MGLVNAIDLCVCPWAYQNTPRYLLDGSELRGVELECLLKPAAHVPY